MIFHFNEQGEPLGYVPERIVSGSVSSKKIFFVCPVNEGNVISVSFLLANGTRTNTHTLTPVTGYTNLSVTDNVGLPCAIYSMDIPGTVIATAGEVSLQFFITDTDGNVVATPISKFTVEQGIGTTTPEDSDSYDDLVTLISRIGTLTTNLKSELNNIATANIVAGTGTGSVVQAYKDSNGTLQKDTANGKLSMAIGEGTIANADNTFASGENTKATLKNQAVVGMNNAYDDTALFLVGNGLTQNSKNNAFTVCKNGKIYADDLLQVEGIFKAKSTSEFTGDATFNSTINVSGDVSMGGDLEVTGDTEITGDLQVDGSLQVDGKSVATLDSENLTDGAPVGYDATNNKLVTVSINKQDTLVSGTNIKTINGASILGSGNITISGGGETRYLTKNASGDNFDTLAEVQSATTFYYNGTVATPTEKDCVFVNYDIANAQSVPTYASSFGNTSTYVDFYVMYNNVGRLVTDSNKDSLGIVPKTTIPYYSIPASIYNYVENVWTFKSLNTVKQLAISATGGAYYSTYDSPIIKADKDGNIKIPPAKFVPGMGVDGCMPGIVSVSRGFYCGLTIGGSSGNLGLYSPAAGTRNWYIESRTTDQMALQPQDVNRIVKAGLTDSNRITGLTDEEKQNARGVIGAGESSLYRHTFTVSFTEPINESVISTTLTLLSKTATAYTDGLSFISDLSNNNAFELKNATTITIDNDSSQKDILFGGYACGIGVYLLMSSNVSGGIDSTYTIIPNGVTIGTDVVTEF